jgi:hypothetical protein
MLTCENTGRERAADQKLSGLRRPRLGFHCRPPGRSLDGMEPRRVHHLSTARARPPWLGGTAHVGRRCPSAGVRPQPAAAGGDGQNQGRIRRLRPRLTRGTTTARTCDGCGPFVASVCERDRPKRLRHLRDGPSAPTVGKVDTLSTMFPTGVAGTTPGAHLRVRDGGFASGNLTVADSARWGTCMARPSPK